MLTAIVVAEIGFWVCLFLGFAIRYGLKLPKLGIAFLIATPLIDLVLLGFSYVSLRETGQAQFMHGFAAFYIAFSIVFGRDIINAMDRRFSHTASGRVSESDSRDNLKKCVIACAITAVLLLSGMVVAGLDGSFWLVYWIIVVVFMPIMWWGFDRFLQRRKGAKSN